MGDEAEVPRRDQVLADANMGAIVSEEIEREMQRLFDLVPMAATHAVISDGLLPPPAEEKDNTLELDLGTWEESIGLVQSVF